MIRREPFNYSLAEVDGVLVCRWTGVHHFSEEDRNRSRAAAREISERLQRHRRPVLLDLSKFDYTYSDGLSEWVHVSNACAARKVRFAIRVSIDNPRVRMFIEIASRDGKVVDLIDSETEALAFLKSDKAVAG